MFHIVYRYIKKISNNNYNSAWKSKRLSHESIKPSDASDNSLAPSINDNNTKLRVRFGGSCLKQERVAYKYKYVVDIYFVYEINLWSYIQDGYCLLGNSLFGAANVTKNADLEK